MMIFLAKGTRSVIRPLFTAPPYLHRCFSSSPSDSNFTVDYFISSLGFSPDKAAKAYKPIAHLKSPEKPDSVLRFLNHHGFAEADIKTLITRYPKILCSSPENSLDPNLRALRKIGLSVSTLTQLILSSPGTLHYRPAVSRIKFWKDFLGGSETALITAIKANRGLTNYDIAPKISFLQSHYGLSTSEIGRIVLTVPRFILCSIPLMEDVVTRAKELGFHPGSPLFVGGLQAVMGNTRDMLQKKMELLKSFGWSEDDLFSALRRCPMMVKISENNLKTKMDFLMGEPTFDLSYIVYNPWLLTFSLEKRLRPRLHVLQHLKSKCLSSKRKGLNAAMHLSDNKFMERYILPHKEEISGLNETFLTACAGEWKMECWKVNVGCSILDPNPKH